MVRAGILYDLDLMNIFVARSAGFCWGVRRAMDAALEASARFSHREVVQTLGPLIHNPQALEHLERRNVRVVGSADAVQDGVVVIRAHGIPRNDAKGLQARSQGGGLRVSNATCPSVARVQSIIKRYADKGCFTVILGQEAHAEVQAHISYACNGHAVVASLEEAEALPQDVLRKTIVVAQTTFAVAEFKSITSCLCARSKHVIVRNTICRDTWERQEEALDIAHQAEIVIVVGGTASNNTRRLVEVVQSAGRPVQQVESFEELDLNELRRYQSVGILAGASTPGWTVDEVVQAVHELSDPRLYRTLALGSKVVHLPFALGAALLAGTLSWGAGDREAINFGFVVLTFCLGVAAAVPFLERVGLEAKGRVRASYLAKYRNFLLGGAVLSGLISITLASHHSWLLGLAMVGMALGTAFFYRGMGKFWSTVRRLPGIKDLGQAMAPAAVFAVYLGTSGVAPRVPLPVGILFTLALAYQIQRHLHEFQEDRVLGREILPVALGLWNARVLAWIMLIFAVGQSIILIY